MKVLHICSYYLSVGVFKDMCDRLIGRGCAIRVFVPLQNGTPLETVYKKDIDHYVDTSHCFGRYDRYVYWLKQRKIYRKIIQQYNFSDFDLTHAHTLFSNGYVSYRLYKKYGLPYVVAVRATDISVFFKRMVWLRGLGVRILQHASAIVFISPQGKEQTLAKYVPDKLKAEIEAKSCVLPNGIAEFWLQNKHTNTLSIQDKPIEILTVGKTAREKNLLRSVSACEALRKRGYNIRHTIIGRVVDRDLADRLRQNDAVTFMDEMDKERLLERMRASHIFFLPSLRETFGLVYAEALTQGLPVVCAQGQGFDGFFEQGLVGYAADGKSIPDMANKLQDIIENYERFKTTCNNVPSLFDWNCLADHYMDIYRKAAERRAELSVALE